MRQRKTKDSPLNRADGALPRPSRGGKRHRSWSRASRAYVLATALFVLTLIGYYATTGQPVLTSHQQWESRLARINTVAVDKATKRFLSSPTFPFMDTLVHVSANTSCALESRLEELTAAEESRERGDPTPEGPTATASAKKALANVASSLQPAGDALYGLLEGMFLGAPDAPLREMPKGLPRHTFALFATTLHLHGAVLPEYYLVADDEARHAQALVRTLNLLDWAVSVPNPQFFNWTADPCRKTLPGTSKKWVTFCQSSLSSSAAAGTRAAAVLEELIALHPDYAPFRLHYATALTLMARVEQNHQSANGVHPASLQTIRSARRAWESHAQASGPSPGDLAHSPELALLTLLEAYAVPLGDSDDALCSRTLEALSVLPSCDALSRLTLLGAQWPAAPFARERRPSLLHTHDIHQLLTKIELVVADKYVGSFREVYASCIG